MSNQPPQVKSILKARSAVAADVPKVSSSAGSIVANSVNTSDMSKDQVRTILQLLNRMMRQEKLTATENAQLCSVKEVYSIFQLHKSNLKEAASQMAKYRSELSTILRSVTSSVSASSASLSSQPSNLHVSSAILSHQPPLPSSSEFDETAKKKPKLEQDEETIENEETLYEPISPDEEETQVMEVDDNKFMNGKQEPEISEKFDEEEIKPILAQPPLGLPPDDFSIRWIQFFFQQMCSRVPFFLDRKILRSVGKKITEESESQRILVDGLSSTEIIYLLNFIFDLEDNIKIKRKSSGNHHSLSLVSVPSKLTLLSRMSDPLDSGLLDQWFFNMSGHCASCALRFSSRKILTNHHDYHFLKNTQQQRRKRGLDVAYRGWMESAQDFLENRSILVTRNFYRKLNGESNLKSKEKIFPEENQNKIENLFLKKKLAILRFEEEQRSSLSYCCPVDEIKNVCFECGENLEICFKKLVIEFPVYSEVVVVPVGSSVPLEFSWGERTIDSINLDKGPISRKIIADIATDGTEKVDSKMALKDKRFIDSLIFHRKCWEANSSLKNPQFQENILSNKMDREEAENMEIREEEYEDVSDMEIDSGERNRLVTENVETELIEEEDDEEKNMEISSKQILVEEKPLTKNTDNIRTNQRKYF